VELTSPFTVPQTQLGYDCECPAPYYGTICANVSQACDINPCENGGTCLDVGSSYQCLCTSYNYGQNCSQFVSSTPADCFNLTAVDICRTPRSSYSTFCYNLTVFAKGPQCDVYSLFIGSDCNTTILFGSTPAGTYEAVDPVADVSGWIFDLSLLAGTSASICFDVEGYFYLFIFFFKLFFSSNN